jgi:predicted cupin superfamily sugar epimerase
MERDARYWIDALKLIPHPEGGYYRQTYRSSVSIPLAGLPPQFPGARRVSTAIYFLLDGADFSAFHRLRSDEMWHFYAGTALSIHVIDQEGAYAEIRLGSDPEAGEVFQAVVQAGCWFASRVCDRLSFALAGCTVAPGFDFEDFELAKRSEFSQRYPQHRTLIEQLTRAR